MKITAIMPCRNSAWCIGATARALLAWVDTLIVLNHASTDDTGAMLEAIQEKYPGRLTILEETGQVWEEMRHRQLLLDHARAQQATHIVTIDDDELLTANLLPQIREMVLACPVGSIMQLPWIQLRSALDTFVSGGQWADQNASMAFVDEPCLGWSARAGYDHHHRHPMGKHLDPHRPLGPAFLKRQLQTGGLMHMQMVSYHRLRAKQALYVMQETVRWPGRMTAFQLNEMYGPTVYMAQRGRGEAFKPESHTSKTPAEWWDGYENLMPFLNINEVPWQEAECKRLMDLHGAATFAGLDLFGVL